MHCGTHRGILWRMKTNAAKLSKDQFITLFNKQCNGLVVDAYYRRTGQGSDRLMLKLVDGNEAVFTGFPKKEARH